MSIHYFFISGQTLSLINLSYMKVSLVSPDFTRKHQANSSPSKYACGFSRTERFRAPNPEYFS